MPSDPQKQCVKPGEFAIELRSGRNPVGAPIELTTNFFPTNQRVDVGVRAPFVDGVRYFAGIDYGNETYLFKRQDVVTHRASESDTLVKKHLLEPDQTIVTLNMGDDLAWFWSRVDLYLYTCNNPVGQSPWRVSSVSVRLSFQLPTDSPPTMTPSAMSVRRDSPRHMTVLPGGGSLARAR
ncbi:hypothetical protein ACVWYH_005053 [Bradyrhizobium sp. GM24.11]